jgi:S-adenosylmethionine:tRNA ribosyltransferase-isomerase
MELKKFMYELPPSLIAAHPTSERTAARLMVVDRATGEMTHDRFAALGDYLAGGDLLVLNDTRVFPARLRGVKETGGAAELLLIEPCPGSPAEWIALVDAAKPPALGSRIFFPGEVAAQVVGEIGRGRYGVRFDHREKTEGDFMDLLSQVGEPPLPHYVRRERMLASSDWERYQTVYAAIPGAVAAPTAGLHFTTELLRGLSARGIDAAWLTLHVGPGTFEPVRSEAIEGHLMEGERYAVGAETAAKVNEVKDRGGKVVAVGTTTTRALEWVARRVGKITAHEGVARLFLKPGDRFEVVDAFVTNFHLPGSTPLMLTAAFAGLDLLRRAYDEAIRERYRFYSYGDAMLIL